MLDTIPTDVLEHLSEYLTPSDRFMWNQTCKECYTLSPSAFPEPEEILASETMLNFVQSIKHFKFDERFFLLAVLSGKRNLLKRMRRLKVPMHPDCYTVAIAENLYHVVHWRYDFRYPLSEDVMEEAVRSDEINLVRWLLERDCPLSKKCLSLAVRGNNYAIVRELLQCGCPWSHHLYNRSVIYCMNHKIVELLYNLSFNDFSKPFFTEFTMMEARRVGNYMFESFIFNKLNNIM